MGQITSGIGLISGINTADLIDQLLSIEARPIQLVQNRNAVLEAQQIAFQSINAQLLSLKLSASGFSDDNTFDTKAASSSNESVLTVSAASSAVPGSYDFNVDRLVTTQQVITGGFADQDLNPIAPGGGTLTFEFGKAKLDENTELSRLNGGAGVQRGSIRVTDRSGSSATVDLSGALTIDDVLEAINNASGISVTASVDGDGFELTDTSGATVTSLAVTEVGTGTTASSLGLTTAAVGNTLTGSQINYLSADTDLSLLNDGDGVRRVTGNDLRVSRQDGSSFDVDLSGAVTLGDVIDAINTADAGVGVTASVNADQTGLDLVDTTVGASTLGVAALNGSGAAADLGILGTDGDGDGTLAGTRLIAAINSKLVKNLNGGSGATLGTISITNRTGATQNVDLSSAQSVSEVLTLINDAGAGVTASLNNAGNGLLLRDTTGATASDLIIGDVSGTGAADLGLAGTYSANEADSGNLQLRYVSEATRLAALNGGKGVASGKFTITDSNGDSATVDLTQGNEVTIQDVLDEINSRGLQINARVNDNGDGIVIEDTGPGLLALKVEEDGANTARDLGLLGEAANAGDDLVGSFERTVTIDTDDTLQDVAQAINDAGIGVTATIINDGSVSNPYRLSLISEQEGKAGAYVFDDGGLDLAATELVEAQDAVVFFGSQDKAKAIAITSPTNSISSVIPGATVDLLGTSGSPVKVTITRDDSAIIDAVSGFVDRFNDVTGTLNDFDSYDVETEERGLLLGDPTVARVRNSLFRAVNNRNTDLTGRYSTLAQIGIKVGSGAKLSFDETKFRDALETDFDAVQALFTFQETETDEDTGEISVTAAGIGVKIEELLDNLTDSVDGVLQLRLNSLDDQIALGDTRIEQLNLLLDNRRTKLEFDFLAMERALAELQSQSSALANFQPLTFSRPSS